MLGNISSQSAWAIIRLSKPRTKPRTVRHGARYGDTVCSLIFMKNISFLFFVQDPGMHAFNFTAKKSYISL